MWYKLNEMLGTVVLIALVGGGAIYGLVLYLETPPLLRQESDGPSPQQLQARKELEKRMAEIQSQHDAAIEDAAEIGRSATSSGS